MFVLADSAVHGGDPAGEMDGDLSHAVAQSARFAHGTTRYRSLTSHRSESGSRPFATVEPGVGNVIIRHPDLVSALGLLFDEAWRTAEPITL